MSDFFEDVFNAYCGPRECKECPLSRETGDCRDLFAKRVIGWAKAHDTADVKADTSSEPICQPRQNGKDINVPTTLPKWVKVGQWVEFTFARDDRPYKILREKHGEVYISNMADDERAVYYGECKPVRFRAYAYEEAKGLLGKTMETSYNGDLVSEVVMRVRRTTPDGTISINDIHFDWLAKEYNATIDGLPIGVPEVDEEAMKEVGE